ncbi:MAG: lysophospholipid acyltransferase family protein [Microcoleaceae cyanobacterium]
MTTSEVSPWLTPAAYFLFSRIVLPTYFGNIDIQGQELLPKSGATILAPTHRSRWDPIILGYAMGRWVTGRDLRYMVLLGQTTGVQGWFVRRLGGFAIDRDRPAASSIRYSIELLQNQEVLVLFPEGHIFLDDEIHPVQSGVARIALQAIENQPPVDLKQDLEPGSKQDLEPGSKQDLKIVPVSIRYDHPAPLPWKCGVRVKIGAPLQVEDYSRDSTKQSAKRLTADLESALRALHQ